MVFDKYFIGDTNKLNWEAIDKYIPEIKLLANCEQNPKWHSEGNAYNHTMKCVEFAQGIVEEWFTEVPNQRTALMSVLLHDIGKLTTTFEKNGVWHAYGHEFASERFARKLLWDEGISYREAVCYCVRFHMEIFKIFEKKNPLEEVVKLMENAPYVGHFHMLIFTKLCDVKGSMPQEEKQGNIDEAKIACINRLRYINVPFDIRKIIASNIKPWEDTRRQVIVMMGLPGAGKDTLISINFNSEKYAVISRDAIRIELGYCNKDEKIIGTPEQEDNVTALFNERFIQALKDNKIPVLNNLNIKKKYRDGYKEILRANGYHDIDWQYYYIEAPSLEDNIKRRQGQILENAFYNMIYNLDWIYCDEGTLIIYQ